MLYAFSCGWQRSHRSLPLLTLFLQRTQLVLHWLRVTQVVLLLHALVSLLNKELELHLCKSTDTCCFLLTLTHLPHFFVAVVSEVQLVCCYDFVPSVIIIIWICWELKKYIVIEI